jgi:peptide deformylase
MSMIITYGNSLLRKKSEQVVKVDADLQALIKDMFETLAREKGVGLAAVQVGHLLRVFITNATKDKPRVFINPEIIETSIEEDLYEEGCLSIPGINSDVTRPFGVKVQAFNEKERPFTLTCDDLLARVIQHEYDHLNGVLFIDRLDTGLKQELITVYTSREPKRAVI